MYNAIKRSCSYACVHDEEDDNNDDVDDDVGDACAKIYA